MQIKSVGKNVVVFCSVILLMGLLTGCMDGMMGGAGSSVPPTNDGLGSLTTAVENYGDIELPIEMTLEPEKSIAMRTDSFQGGIHTYIGRVQMNSLKDYILASMRNNKWKLAGEASYKDIMLAFTKANKTCMVILSEGTMNEMMGKTEAKFYVTVDLATAKQVNQFGAPISQ